jgi:hypothetical protein
MNEVYTDPVVESINEKISESTTWKESEKKELEKKMEEMANAPTPIEEPKNG